MGLATGFGYFYEDVLGLDPANVICAYDFHIQSGNQIPTQSWTTNGVNGTVNSSGNFYSTSGSGAFNGTNYIHINSGFNLDSWTVFFTYQKLLSGRDEILLSTITGNSLSSQSGFQIAINQANKLYIEYGNNISGPQIFTFSEILGDKNMISVSRSDSTIFFNYFDCNSKQSTVQLNDIFQNYFIDSTQFYIGGRPNSSYWSPSNNFSGYMDNFVLVSGNLDQNYVQILYSGFYSQYSNDIPTTGIACENVSYLTGVSTGVSGLIGNQVVAIGSLTDNCGNTQILYGYSGVSGFISGTSFITITGTNCVINSGVSGQGLQIFSGYLNSFGLDQISLAWTIQSGDWTDSYVLTGLYSDITRNKIANWSALNGLFFLDDVYSSGAVGLYLNGQLELQSGITSVPNGYTTSYILSGDYFLSGLGASNVYSTGYYEEDDLILYDVVNQNINSVLFTGFNSGLFPNVDFSNKLVYLNGQKLRSGISGDYITPNTLFLNVDSGNNVLSLYNLTGFSQYTGANSGVLSFPNKFLRRTSQTFFNGVRGEIGNYYWESSSIGLLGKNYVEPSQLNALIFGGGESGFLNWSG